MNVFFPILHTKRPKDMFVKYLSDTKQKFEVENNLRKSNGIIGKWPILICSKCCIDSH